MHCLSSAHAVGDCNTMSGDDGGGWSVMAQWRAARRPSQSSIWERRLLGYPVPGPPTTLLSPACTSPEPAPPASDLPTRLTARAKPPLTQWAPPTGSSAPAPYPHLLARTTAPPAVRPLHLSHCTSRKPGVHKRPAHQQPPPPAQAGPLRNTAAATSRHAARPCSVMAARPLYQEAAGSPGSSPGMVTLRPLD